jgi:hypothetical protein
VVVIVEPQAQTAPQTFHKGEQQWEKRNATKAYQLVILDFDAGNVGVVLLDESDRLTDGHAEAKEAQTTARLYFQSKHVFEKRTEQLIDGEIPYRFRVRIDMYAV